MSAVAKPTGSVRLKGPAQVRIYAALKGDTRRELDDDPVIFALKDPASLALGAVVIAAFSLAL